MQVSNIRPITQLATNDSKYIDGRPCFSPDGNTVLFERGGSDLKFAQFWSVPLNDSKQEQCFYYSDFYGCFRASWSWNNVLGPQTIAFTGVNDKGVTLWLLEPGAEPNSATQLLVKNHEKNALSYPAWFADGESLLISNYSNLQLIKVNLANHDVWTLTPELFSSGMGTVSATNSNLIAFAGQPRTDQPYNQNINQIWIQDGFNDPVLFSSDEKNAIGRAPWFSQDGAFIAYEALDASGLMQIYIKSVAQPYNQVSAVQVSLVTEKGMYAQHGKFSPDGKTIIWAQQTSKNCSQIYAASITY